LKAFIFDMDGTILNSMACWYSIGNRILKMNGLDEELPPSSLERLTLYQGMVMIKEVYKIEKSVEELEREVYEYIYGQYRNYFTLKEGTIELFDYIKENGGRIGLATATDMKYVKGFLENQKGIEKYFDFIETVKNEGPTKNEPEFFLKAVKNFVERPEKVFMFEDAPHAMEAAKKAGMIVVGIIEDTRKDLRDLAIEISDYHFESIVDIDRSIFGF